MMVSVKEEKNAGLVIDMTKEDLGNYTKRWVNIFTRKLVENGFVDMVTENKNELGRYMTENETLMFSLYQNEKFEFFISDIQFYCSDKINFEFKQLLNHQPEIFTKLDTEFLEFKKIIGFMLPVIIDSTYNEFHRI